MTFPKSIELFGNSDANGNPQSRVYDEQYSEKGTSVRMDISVPLGESSTLTLAHKPTGRGINKLNTHLVKLERKKKDEDGNVRTLRAYACIHNPDDFFTEEDILDLKRQLGGFLYQDDHVKWLIRDAV